MLMVGGNLWPNFHLHFEQSNIICYPACLDNHSTLDGRNIRLFGLDWRVLFWWYIDWIV